MDNFGLFKILSNLYEVINKNKNTKNNEGDFSAEEKQKPLNDEQKDIKKPLNEDLIKTSINHDEFIKRVLQKNK